MVSRPVVFDLGICMECFLFCFFKKKKREKGITFELCHQFCSQEVNVWFGDHVFPIVFTVVPNTGRWSEKLAVIEGRCDIV